MQEIIEFIEKSRYSHAYVPRINHGGNYCGHYREKPRLKLDEPIKKGKGQRPSILFESQERIQAYFSRPSMIPGLRYSDGRIKTQYSARREACILILSAILKRTDLVSLRVGIPTVDGFMPFDQKYLAKEAGLGIRRATRAIRDLKLTDLISVTRRYETLPSGEKKPITAVRCVKKVFFELLGLGERLEYERQKASQRLREQHKKDELKATKKNVTRTEKARYGNYIRTVGGTIGQAQSPKSAQSQCQSGPPDPEYQRLVQMAMIEIMKEQPDWPVDRVREAAANRVRGDAVLRA